LAARRAFRVEEETRKMKLRRTWRAGIVFAIAGAALVPACSRRKTAEINPITPSFAVNRTRAPLGSAVEVTYTWTLDPNAKKLTKDYRALVHFLDSHGVMLFEDDHVPQPPPTSWEPGKTYSYTRTKFIPIYPYVGKVEVRMGLYKDRERVALKGEDTGMQEYKVAGMELLPQTENIFLVYKEGWHSPENHPENPSLERTWTKKDAVVSFKNPKRDVVVYLEADTCVKCFPAQPVLTLAVGGKKGLTVPIENAEVFLKKIRFKAADLGTDEWVDLRFSMNQSFVPKLLTPPMNQDDRELGLLVYHLYVGEEDKLGSPVPQNIVDATPVTLPAAAPAAAGPAKSAGSRAATQGTAARAKATPGTKSPAPKKS
jgi:hypothetical protein